MTLMIIKLSLIKGVTTGCILPIGYKSALVPLIQTLLSLKYEIVFNKSKRVIEPIVCKNKIKQNKTKKTNKQNKSKNKNKNKKNRRGFALFKRYFLRNRSLSNARWFYGKKHKIGKENLYLTENCWSKSKLWCAADNLNYMCYICAKKKLDSKFNEAVIEKISHFPEIVPNFTYSQKLWFLKYNSNFLDQLLFPYTSNGRDM